MLHKNLKIYLLIEESLIMKFVSMLILSVNDVAAFLSLNMRNLKDNAVTFSNKGWSVSLIVHMLHQSLRFGNKLVLFGYVSITEH